MITHRMTWLRELRWAIATKLLAWAFAMMRKEMNLPAAIIFSEFVKIVEPDKRFQTIKLNRPRRDPREQWRWKDKRDGK